MGKNSEIAYILQQFIYYSVLGIRISAGYCFGINACPPRFILTAAVRPKRMSACAEVSELVDGDVRMRRLYKYSSMITEIMLRGDARARKMKHMGE